MPRRVVFRPSAQSDLAELFDYIAENGGPRPAHNYLDRIEAACLSLAEFPERGTIRDDLYPGIRIIGFERRASIAFLVTDTSVRIVRVFYGGRQFPDNWEEPEDPAL